MTPNNTARTWLLENGYISVVKNIDKIVAKWKVAGKKTRRNWWNVLAGHKDGSSSIIEGIKFPVLQAARIRKGWGATSKSICRNAGEAAPPAVSQMRWEKNKSKGGESI